MKNWSSHSASGLSSPSILLIAGLVALLFVGYGTDWRILFGRSAVPKPPARFGATEMAVGAHRTRHLRQGFIPGAVSSSDVADSRSQTADR